MHSLTKMISILTRLTAAIKKRIFLLGRLLEDRQYFPDGNEEEDDDDDDNVSTPYELKSELNHYQ